MRRYNIVSSAFLVTSAFLASCTIITDKDKDKDKDTPVVEAGTPNVENQDAGSAAVDTGSPSSADAAATDAAASAIVTVANVGAVDFTGTGDVVFTDKSGSVNTETGEASTSAASTKAYKFLEVDQPLGAGKLAVFVAKSFRFESSSVTNVQGARGVVFVALDKIEVFGSLSGGAQHTLPGPGGSACTMSGKGGGVGGGSAAFNWNGAGGASYCGLGGTGNSVSDAGVGGVPGPAYGSPTLIPLLGGSAGGGNLGSNGGGGGGAIQLSARGSITIGIAGAVDVGGGGGSSGCAGGSGGAILIEAPIVTVAGTLAANGAGGAVFKGGGGNDAQPGKLATPGEEPTAGAGSADTTINGGAGTMVAGDNNSSGAGGGGAGRIRINTTTGAAAITGIVSPAVSTACVTQGMLP